jgi:hypothetical protein
MSRDVERLDRLRDEHVDDRVLEFTRDVGLVGVRERSVAFTAPNERQHRGLEAAKAHVEISAVQHRPRQRRSAFAARLRQLRKCRTARIGKPEQLRCLVESFTRRVVLSVAKKPIAAHTFDIEQLAVTAGDEQRDKRKPRLRLREQRRKQMPF